MPNLHRRDFLLGAAGVAVVAVLPALPGAGQGVTLLVPETERVVAGMGPVVYEAGEVRGLQLGQRYFLYFDDPTLRGGAVDYRATSLPDDLLRAGRVYLGEVTV